MDIPALLPQYKQTVEALLARDDVKAAMALCESEADRAIEEQIHLSEIESPTFAEETRGKELARLFREYGLTDIETDKVGNVIARRQGAARVLC